MAQKPLLKLLNKLSSRTSWVVMMTLMCSKLITIAHSRPNTLDGYERNGSKIRMSRAGRPVRRMIACLLASTTWACLLESRAAMTSRQAFSSAAHRTPPTDMPRPGIMGRVGSGQSCPPLGLWQTGWVVTGMRDSHHYGWELGFAGQSLLNPSLLC
ncbi:hypothetical protein ACFX2F_006811 [Malus domestica]